MGGHGLASSDTEEGKVAAPCEHGNEALNSTKCREFTVSGTISFSRIALCHGDSN
jgi:hypothetical protein